METSVRILSGMTTVPLEQERGPTVSVPHEDDEYLLWLSTNSFGRRGPDDTVDVYWRAALARRVGTTTSR